MAEIVATAFALRGRTDAWLQASWRSRVAPLLPNWPTFAAVLTGPHGYAPDFLTPVPRTGRPALAEELAGVAATPLDDVAEQVLAGWTGHDASWAGMAPHRCCATQTNRVSGALTDTT